MTQAQTAESVVKAYGPEWSVQSRCNEKEVNLIRKGENEKYWNHAGQSTAVTGYLK